MPCLEKSNRVFERRHGEKNNVSGGVFEIIDV